MKRVRLFERSWSGAQRSPRRRVGTWLRMVPVTIAVLCGTLFASAVGARPLSYTIWLYNSQHVLVDETAYYGYQNGHVYDLATDAVIGSVPDPNTGIIYDSNNNDIGEVESAS